MMTSSWPQNYNSTFGLPADLDLYALASEREVVAFGTGHLSLRTKELPFLISYFVDNDSEKQGSTHLGLPVLSPNHFVSSKRDRLILVASTSYKAISEQLIGMGLREQVDFIDLLKVLRVFHAPYLSERFFSLRDIHRGRRAFVIGNGPSLTIDDLHHLKEEITFGANKIYLAFSETEWRPTYYTVSDFLVARNNHVQIEKVETTRFIADIYRPFFPNGMDPIWFNLIVDEMDSSGNQNYFSRQAEVGIYPGGSVLIAQLQLAWHMGIREIYMIGLDFRFDHLPGKKAQILTAHRELNHFHPEYRTLGEEWNWPDLETQRIAFAEARKVFEAEGGRIFNASRRTCLDVLPRIDYDQLFSLPAS